MHLLSWCNKEKAKHAERWEEDQAALRPLPATPFSSASPKPAKVNTYALVTVDRNQYSVPCQYVGQMVLAKAYVDRIEIIIGRAIVASHVRCYQRGQVFMEIRHYLTVLERKPHAVTNASVVRQLPAVFGTLREHMTQAHRRGYKDFLNILLLFREHSVAEVAATIEQMDAVDVSATAIKQRLSPSPNTAELMDAAGIVTTQTQAAQYDLLLQEGVG